MSDKEDYGEEGAELGRELMANSDFLMELMNPLGFNPLSSYEFIMIDVSKENDKEYFTPNIEDIRVGYELETNYNREQWEPLTITEENISLFLEQWEGDAYDTEFRVPFLSKDQIEREGWEFMDKYDSINRKVWSKGNNWLVAFVEYSPWRIQIIPIDPSKEEPFEFAHKHSGECRDINTLRTIMKLLNIK